MTLSTEFGHTVYAKATWAGAWTEVPNLKALECQWNAAPQFNSALLRWDLGPIIMPGDSAPTLFGPWIGRGQFIRVDWLCDDGVSILRWVGFADAAQWPTEQWGSQHIACYGLERALALTPIVDRVWRDDGGTLYRSQVPPTFNGGSGLHVSGLRSAELADTDPDVYAFAPAGADDGELWSTRQIVRYLLSYHLPTGNFGVASIPWSIDQLTQLPDWDAPTVHTLGRTVWDVLVELITPQRQLGFTVGSDGSTCYLRCFTHLASPLVVGSNTLPANPRQHSLAFTPDALTDVQLADVGGGFDQVICRGARRQTICTLRYGTELDKDWTAGDETAYEAAASGEAGYGALSESQKQQRNAAARARKPQVYRRMKLDAEWDFTIDADPIFEGNENPHAVRILERLPIVADGRDWSGAVDPLDFTRSETLDRPLLVVWEDPTDTLDYVDNAALEQLTPHLEETLEFSFTVRPAAWERGVELIVDGGPQHAIAAGDFTGQAVDVDVSDLLDFQTMLCTVAIEEDRYCEARYPADESLGIADVIRRLVVDCGPGYQQIRIHADTVTGVDAAGDLTTSDGGVLVDDTAALQTIARVIAAGAVLTRKTVRWSTLRRSAAVVVGDLIVTAAGATVVAPVVSLHLQAEVGVNRPARPVRQTVEVYRGSNSVLSVLSEMQ